MTFGYRAFLDIFMETSRWKCHQMLNSWHLGIELFWTFSWKNWHGMLNPESDHLGIELFWTFSWKHPAETDMGCLICDIWVSSFFWHFHLKNPDKIWHRMLTFMTFGYLQFFWHFHGKIYIKMTSAASLRNHATHEKTWNWSTSSFIL